MALYLGRKLRLFFTIIFVLIFLVSTQGYVYGDDLGKGVKAYKNKNFKKAYKLWRGAAANGNSKAQFFLGNMFYKGIGVAQNDDKAVKWFKRSAEQGSIRAQNNLGTMYMRGLGVTKNNLRAFMWLHITAIQGDKVGIKNRDLVAKLMSKTQIERGQQLAKECKENKYTGCY